MGKFWTTEISSTGRLRVRFAPRASTFDMPLRVIREHPRYARALASSASDHTFNIPLRVIREHPRYALASSPSYHIFNHFVKTHTGVTNTQNKIASLRAPQLLICPFG